MARLAIGYSPVEIDLDFGLGKLPPCWLLVVPGSSVIASRRLSSKRYPIAQGAGSGFPLFEQDGVLDYCRVRGMAV
jgi:hypothetical protein